MDDEIKPLPHCCPRSPKFQCCLWAVRLGPVDNKNQTQTQRKLFLELCATLNFGAWGFIWWASIGFDFVHLLYETYETLWDNRIILG
jgi:hypothetical protein